MKDVSELRVFVMTLPHTPHRYWFALGMLDALRFELPKCHTVMGRYWRDYESCDAMIDAAIEDGFPWFDKLRIWEGLHDIEWSYRTHFWSVCRILRYIASQPYPSVLMEDDLRFTVKKWELWNALYQLPVTAETVILSPPPDYAPKVESIPYNENWMSGEYPRVGGFCNVYTPAGAQKALEIASEGESHTYEKLAKYYDKETTFYPTKHLGALFNSNTPTQCASIHPSDAPHMNQERKEFEGYNSLPVLGRWSEGLNIDP